MSRAARSRLIAALGVAACLAAVAALRWRSMPGPPTALEGPGLKPVDAEPVPATPQVRGGAPRRPGAEVAAAAEPDTPVAPDVRRASGAPPEQDAGAFGRVRFPDGAAARARVAVLALDLASARVLETDDAGRFALPAAQSEGRVLAARAPRAGPADVWIAGPSEVSGGDAAPELVLRPAASVAVAVVDERGRAVDGYTVELEEVDASELDRHARALLGLPAYVEHEPGHFLAAGLEHGVWRLVVRAPGHVPAGPYELSLPRAGPPLRAVLLREARAAGRVVDAFGAPVPGAVVLAHGEAEQAGVGAGEPDGAFELALAPGAVRLEACAPGWASSAPLELDLAAGQRVELLELALRHGGRLEVRVDVVAGYQRAAISVRHAAGECDRWSTARDGGVVFGHLVAGQYAVEAGLDLAGGGRATLRGAAEVVAGATARVVLGAPSDSAMLVRARVHRRGEPVGGTLTLRDVLRGTSLSAELDRDGRCELAVDGPGPFEHHVRVADAEGDHYGRVEIPAVEVFELDIALSGASLGGVVLDEEGAPCAGVVLELAPDPAVADLSAAGASARARTGAGGRFLFRDLLAGTYALELPLAVEQGDASRYARRSVRGIELAEDEQREDLVLALTPPAALQGTVRDARLRRAPGARVVVLDAQGRPLPRGDALAEANGRYRVEGLPCEPVLLVAYSEDEVSDVEGPFDLSSGGAREHDLDLHVSGALRVRVTEPDGRAVGAALRVLDKGGVDLAAIVGVTSDGADDPPPMRVGPLAPGSYLVRALNHDRLAAERRVHVLAGETASVELVLPNGPR